MRRELARQPRSGNQVGKQDKSFEPALPDAVASAIDLHRAGRLDEAELVYRQVLASAPEQPDALHFLGLLMHQRGRGDAGIPLIERSIALDPGRAYRYNNLGNVLIELDRLAEGTRALQRAIALDPGHADAHSNLGAVLRAQGRFEEAAAAYLHAIEIDPGHVNAYCNFGILLSGQGLVAQAVECFRKAIALAPSHPQARPLLGVAYYRLGQIESAAAAFREWLEDEPANPIARHMLAACTGEDVPARASDAYVEAVFDGFAGSFERKLERLDYRAPGLIAAALTTACDPPARTLVTLDAGCGTGLCGSVVAPYASHITGVDLSAGMLANAHARHVYHELIKAELSAYLADHPGAFDLIVSADTLVYFGALEPVLQAASCALRPRGILIFTAEECDDPADDRGYRINPHGRYSHRRDYVERALGAAQFDVLAVERAVLRLEAGHPVAGLVITARKSGDTSDARTL
jgi:predicted TPR repeat methyltransferase